jgi:DNA invertase Pin-like site-specific DNA recombinase
MEIEMERQASGTLIPAAEYVRMSTDHQQYSTANQSDAIRAYAAKRGMEIIRTYADEGKSGLSLYMRSGLRRLLQDVQSGDADFTAIIVFDVSRWGRFQDSDEAAYHEFICKLAGISVHYCAEQFENDGSPISTIVKSIKRAMAGEYSRELSVKVFAGQKRIVEQGFRLGALAGYGLRRTLVDQHGSIKCSLTKGEWKSITTDRVVLSLGPSEELEIVRSMYAMFVQTGK